MIEEYQGKPISKTKLLYNYNHLNSVNIHKYIDGKEHLLCVIKTANTILAAYYPGALRKDAVMNEGGLLISVTNNESYHLLKRTNKYQKIYQGMIYDPFFLVFGNFDIRIRNGSQTVSSRFGTNSSFFDSKGRRVNDLLSEGESSEVVF